MDYNSEIIDEVLKLRKMGLSIPKVANAISRQYPRYCWNWRKSKNLQSPDVLKIIDILKNEGRLPASSLDRLKVKISNGRLGKSRMDTKNL